MYMPSYPDAMDQDVYNDAGDQGADPEGETQQPTQSTQHASQPAEHPEWDSHLWGYLQPCRENLTRIDCWKLNASVSIGRSKTENDICLSSMKISNKHCVLQWDGKEDSTSIVTVQDLSSNGTFINGRKVGRNRTSILRDGAEVGIGSWAPTPGYEDFRYIFRFVAAGPARSGLHAFYDIGHEIGKGSFATVMSAISRETGLIYAVKMIQKSKFRARGPDAERMFLREVSITQSLAHPNIVQMKETFEDDNCIYLVLEFVDGGDLLDYIITRGGLSEEETRYLTAQLCEALAYIHGRGIAHRDLKPENVLVTKTNPPIIKVADFGLAKAVDSMTNFKTTCGTPCYLAPEVILRNPEQGYDHLVDSWSVGVIVFSMITNASPFIDNDHKDIRERFLSRFIDWQAFYDANVSDEALSFVQGLLRDNPKQRFSMEDALAHPWLARVHPPTPDAERHRAPAPASDEMHVSDEEIGSPGRTPGPSSAQREFLPDADHDFVHVKMEDIAEIAGSQPASQGTRQPLKKRVVALAECDPDGMSQNLDLEMPAQLAAEARGKGKARARGANARANGRRGGNGNGHEMGESDSASSPPSGDADGDEHLDTPSGPYTRRAAARKRGAANLDSGEASPRKTRGRAPYAVGTNRATRASTRVHAK